MDIKNMLEADLEFQKALRCYFVKTYQNKFEEIIKILEAGDITAAHRIVHSLKGNAAQLGKENLKKAAFDVEQQLKNGVNETANKQLQILKSELSVVLNELSLSVNEQSQ